MKPFLPRLLLAAIVFGLGAAEGAEGRPGDTPGETLDVGKREEFRARLNEATKLFHSAHDPDASMKLLLALEPDCRATPGAELWVKSVLWKMAQIHGAAGRLERSAELYEEARELVFAHEGSEWSANHFLVLSNLCWTYERLGRMGMLAIRHSDAVERARGYFAFRAGTPPDADPFSHDDATLDRLNNIGFLGQVYAREALLRFQAGREDEAIELAKRLERRLREPFKNHWERDLRARTRLRLVEWLDELGRTAERDDWENRLLVPEGLPGAGSEEWHLGRVRRAARLHKAGDARASQRAVAEASLAALRARNQTAYWLEGQAVLARMAAAEERGADGLALLDTAIEEIAELQEPLAFARLLLARAELRLELGVGAGEETGRDIHAALAWFRSVGGRREEPEAYLIYARYLRQAGRTAEAGLVLSDALGRLRSFAAPALRRKLAAEWEQLTPGRSASAGAVRMALSDLQPVETLTRIGEREVVTAGFAVTNPGDLPVAGVVRVRGRVESVRWDEPGLVWRVMLSDAASPDTASQVLRLEPMDQARVILSRRGRAALAVDPVELTWTAGAETQTAWWRFAADGVVVAPRLGNDSLALGNPFYAVPLMHSLRLPDPGDARAPVPRLDLRVKASAPCRVEILRANDGEVLAVDAQGDGDFRGAGDLLWEDANHDGYPDLAATGAGEAGIELLVSPRERAASVTIFTEGRVGGGEWSLQTTDQVLGE